jgi:hypothetical protein
MNQYPFLILRELKINYHPLDLISVSEDYIYNDLEYEPDEDEDLVDGYEVNIFEYKPVTKISSKDYIPEFIVKKEFLPKSLIGNASEGDIGIMEEVNKNGSITYKFMINNDLFREYYESIYLHYLEVVKINNRFSLVNHAANKILSILVSANRNKQIEILERND